MASAPRKICRLFSPTFCGADSVVAGLSAIESGLTPTCTWVMCDHPNYGTQVYDTWTIGREVINGVLCWRIGVGAGSFALCASSEPQALANAAANLSYRFGVRAAVTNGWVFRQPMPHEKPQESVDAHAITLS